MALTISFPLVLCHHTIYLKYSILGSQKRCHSIRSSYESDYLVNSCSKNLTVVKTLHLNVFHTIGADECLVTTNAPRTSWFNLDITDIMINGVQSAFFVEKRNQTNAIIDMPLEKCSTELNVKSLILNIIMAKIVIDISVTGTQLQQYQLCKRFHI